MVDYVKMAKTALRLITKNGRTLEFTINSEEPTDPTKPWRGTDDTKDTVFSAKAVVVPYEDDDIDGTLVRRGDKRIFVAEDSVTGKTMTMLDSVLDQGEIWKVKSVNTIGPGDKNVLYEIQMRR